MSFYLKYRPQKIDDLDLKSVREVLTAVLKAGKVAHAYLFVGPRGLGKTSTARILAKLVNCKENQGKTLGEPCGKCDACRAVEQGQNIDVIEIDAASNTGVDSIRDLREKIGLAPVGGAKRVYIIDEVHMLSIGAFNALLKTLEEPPEHAMFILCTTEEQKVPETVVSRCVRVPFVKAGADEVLRSLRKVVNGEKLKIGEEALELLAKNVDGSFREGHKLLEQLAQKKKGTVNLSDVEEMIDGSRGVDPRVFAQKLLDGDAKGALDEIDRLEKTGAAFTVFAVKLTELIRDEIRAQYGIGKSKLKGADIQRLKDVAVRVMQTAVEVKRATVEQLPLELLAVDLGREDAAVKDSGGERPVTLPKVKEVPVRVGKIEKLPVTAKAKGMEAVEEASGKTDTIVRDINVSLEEVNSKWNQILSTLAPKNHSVAGLLRSTKPKAVEGKFLILEVFYKFHKEQLEQDMKRRMLEEALAQVVAPLSVRCILGEKASEAIKAMPEHDNVGAVAEDAKLAEAVKDVFGLETH